jgi:uncharacterized RDD family membrane protein YckC
VIAAPEVVAAPADGASTAPAARTGTYAGLLTRAVALGIDALVVTCLIAAMTAVARALLSSFNRSGTSGGGSPLLLALVSGVVAFVYYTLSFACFGRTVGKLILGVRVVRADGHNPTLWRSALRTVGYLVSSIFMLGFAWAGIDRRHQAWHDKLAQTFVVYAWDARTGSALVPRVDRPLVPHDR